MFINDIVKSNVKFLETKIPKQYRELGFWLLVCLLIRLIFLPFAFHADLLSTYYRSNLILNGDLSFFYGLSEYAIYFQAVTLIIFHTWIPSGMWFAGWGSPLGFGTASIVDWMEFASLNNVMQYVTIFKIPYLIFDLSCVVLLYYLFKDCKKSQMIALSAWVACPVLIYAAYIFGRYETITFFFILLSLYCVKTRNYNLAMLALGVAIIIRMYPLMLLPLYVILLEKGIFERVKLAILGCLPIFIVFLSKQIIDMPITSGSTSVLSSSLPFSNHLLEFQIGNISLFLLAYVLILAYSVYYNPTDSSKFETLVSFGLLFFISMFLFSPFLAIKTTYFSWILPFLIIWISLVPEKIRVESYLFLIATWLLLMLIRLDPSQFGAALFSPLNYAFIDLPNFGTVLSQSTGFSGSVLKVISVSLFSAALIIMAGLVLLKLVKPPEALKNDE